jgi:hypothetical protein
MDEFTTAPPAQKRSRARAGVRSIKGDPRSEPGIDFARAESRARGHGARAFACYGIFGEARLCPPYSSIQTERGLARTASAGRAQRPLLRSGVRCGRLPRFRFWPTWLLTPLVRNGG